MLKVTQADMLRCPLWKLNVVGDVQNLPNEGLSVGVVNTDKPVETQKEELDVIKSQIIKVCTTQCLYHVSKCAGGCEPACIYRGGMISTVIVNQQDEFPESTKDNPLLYYSKILKVDDAGLEPATSSM